MKIPTVSYLFILMKLAGYYFAYQRIKKYEDGYFFFPNDDTELYLVDSKEPLDRNLLARYNSRLNSYWLFTRANPTTKQIIKYNDKDSVTKSNFDFKKVTVFSVHGWRSDASKTQNKMLAKAFLKDDDVNFIAVDWSVMAGSFYTTSKTGTIEVGKYLGQFINWMADLGMSYDKTHLVGFSLGAHVVGNAGRETGSKVKKITALDPAKPLFGSEKKRLAKTDAKYVEVIHTNTRLFGFTDPLGHADFYVNGGRGQPACYLPTCSHSMAYKYMASTVENKHLKGKQCKDYKEAKEDKCTGSEYIMGTSDLTKSREGIFRTNTKKEYPYIIPNGVSASRYEDEEDILNFRILRE